VPDWQAVARLTNERMRELAMTQRELSERSGVSIATLRRVQHGENQARSRATLTNVSRALGLADDHLWNIAMRRSGTRTKANGQADAQIREELAELRRRVERIEERLSPEATD
jgi:transcriptional regulator with XRE-family HTH domain